MAKMYFIPGMRPGNVSGAAGRSAGKSRGPAIVSGSAYAGHATPKRLVPFEAPKARDTAKQDREARAKDVADALHFVRDAPNSAREKLNETRRTAESVLPE